MRGTAMFSPTLAISAVMRLPIGPSAAMSAVCGWSLVNTMPVISSTRALKPSLRATKSVSQLTSASTPIVRSSLTLMPTMPSEATRPARLAA